MKFKKQSPKEKEPKPSPKPSPKEKDSPKPSPKQPKPQEKHPMSSSEMDTPSMSPNLSETTPAEEKPAGGGKSEGEQDQDQDKDKETKPAPKASKLVNAMAVAAGYAAIPESAAHRNNNPIGQPSESPSTKPQTATGTDGTMCTFATVDDGIRAAEAFTKDLVGGKIPPYTPDMTLTEAAATYWPQDPTGWAKTLAKELSKDDKGQDTGSVTPDSKLSELPQ